MEKVYTVETIAKSHNITIKGQSYTLKKNITLKFTLTEEEYRSLKSNQYIKIQEMKEVAVKENKPVTSNGITQEKKNTEENIEDDENEENEEKVEENVKLTKDAVINEVVKKANNFNTGKNKKNKNKN